MIGTVEEESSSRSVSILIVSPTGLFFAYGPVVESGSDAIFFWLTLSESILSIVAGCT
jgi:hypothetical protein